MQDGRGPKSNTAYWDTKLQRNADRDLENRQALAYAGWKALVVWECELGNTEGIIAKICECLDS